jgi:SOS-response transcriptional repressor LexA
MQEKNNRQRAQVYSLDERRRAATRNTQQLLLLASGASFQVTILDDSMDGASMLKGDVLDCERANTIMPFTHGVFQTPRGLVVRFFVPDGDLIRLEPANGDYPVLCLPASQVQIIGRLKKLIRTFPACEESEVA